MAYGFIGNGFGNSAQTGSFSTIVNGAGNKAYGNFAFIGNGGYAGYTTYGNIASGGHSFIGNGMLNKTSGLYSFIGNGTSNTAITASAIVQGTGAIADNQSFIGVGTYNTRATGNLSFIGNGTGNSAITNSYATIVNGKLNKSSGYYSFIANGSGNTASGKASSILAGTGHTVSGRNSAIIGGGSINGTANDTVYVPNLNIQTDKGISFGTGSTKAYVELNIGDWNMNLTTGVNIAHGLSSTEYKTIRGISVIIRDDTDTYFYSLQVHNDLSSQPIAVDSTNIILQRVTGGYFDTTSFDSTSFNRGWVNFWYTPD